MRTNVPRDHVALSILFNISNVCATFQESKQVEHCLLFKCEGDLIMRLFFNQCINPSFFFIQFSEFALLLYGRRHVSPKVRAALLHSGRMEWQAAVDSTIMRYLGGDVNSTHTVVLLFKKLNKM